MTKGRREAMEGTNKKKIIDNLGISFAFLDPLSRSGQGRREEEEGRRGEDIIRMEGGRARGKYKKSGEER